MEHPVRALLLYSSGAYEQCAEIPSLRESERLLGAHMQLLTSNYVDHEVLVSQESAMSEMNSSRWTALLSSLGFWSHDQPLRGNAVVQTSGDQPFTTEQLYMFIDDFERRQAESPVG